MRSAILGCCRLDGNPAPADSGIGLGIGRSRDGRKSVFTCLGRRAHGDVVGVRSKRLQMKRNLNAAGGFAMVIQELQLQDSRSRLCQIVHHHDRESLVLIGRQLFMPEIDIHT